MEVIIRIVLIFKDIILTHMIALVLVINIHNVQIIYRMSLLAELLMRNCLGLLLDHLVGILSILLFNVMLASLVEYISTNNEHN